MVDVIRAFLGSFAAMLRDTSGGKGGGGDAPEFDPIPSILAQARVNRLTQFTPEGTLRYGFVDPASGSFVANQPGAAPAAGDTATPAPTGAPRLEGFWNETTGAMDTRWVTPDGATATGPAPASTAAPGGIETIPNALRIEESKFNKKLRGSQESTMLELARVLGGNELLQGGEAVRNAIFEREMGLLRPEFSRQREDLTQDLANRGLPMSGEAYTTALDRLDRSQNEAANRAALQATLGEGAERSRQLQELAFLMQGGTDPNFSGPAAIDATGPFQQAYQSQLAGYQADQQAQQGLLGGLFGLAGAAAPWLMLSDRDAKHVGPEVEDGALGIVENMPVSLWQYKADVVPGDRTPHIGPMAQDMAAVGLGDGKTIDMRDGFGLLLAAMKELSQKVDGQRQVV